MQQKMYHCAMFRRTAFLIAALAFAAALIISQRAQGSQQGSTPQASAQPASRPGGWTIPPNAADEKNPLAGDAKALDTGKQLFDKTCKKCHGPGGKGDGPDADPDHQEDMDLTVARRATRNADGVVFYKIWNGRQKPKMPAQKDKLSKEQVWAIVTYVQTLREKP
jgi:mono/diheme cytochrome c family protein